MFVGRVVGSVWSSVKWPEMGGLKLLAVQPYHLLQLAAMGADQPAAGATAPAGAEGRPLPACHDLVICADVLGAGVGEDVVIAYGHAARVALEEALGAGQLPMHPVDAAVVAIVDRFEVQREALEVALGRQPMGSSGEPGAA